MLWLFSRIKVELALVNRVLHRMDGLMDHGDVWKPFPEVKLLEVECLPNHRKCLNVLVEVFFCNHVKIFNVL